MAYGIKLVNQLNEEIVDFNQTLYTKESGTTKLSTVIFAEANALATAAGVPNSFGYRYQALATSMGEGTLPAAYNSFACGGGAITTLSAPHYILMHPELPLLDRSDLTFFDVSTYGIHTAFTVFLSELDDGLTPPGGVTICGIEGNNSIAYKVASIAVEEPPSYADSVGLQLFNAAGDKTFDSRRDFITILDHLVIHKDVMRLVIEENIPFDIKLNGSYTNFKVAPVNFVNFYQLDGPGSSDKMVVPLLKKVDDSTLRLTRHIVYGSDAYTAGTYRAYYQDTALLIGV